MTGAEKLDQLKSDYKTVFESEAGRRVLGDLQRFCNVGLGVPAAITDAELRHIEGMRAVFWHCFWLIFQDNPPTAKAKTPPLLDYDVFADLQRRPIE